MMWSVKCHGREIDNMFNWFKKKPRLSRDEQDQLFALDELIQKVAHPKRPTTTRHPMRMNADPATREDMDIADAQNRIKRILGIDK